ncbi:uncharacterized protein N7496_010206 [Penicillium cataractarum]|uniref:F-box domain-containing protein n=1 Tax=Penicillium cataractarum TaxID=2100454 RepID=A0A9W9V0N1_9EURO|nr:uncharacterized protein N7496_010206 [Penicillium cataractarum]KAJ5364493.1 hypothetical protein N7496_010206 [Penicillium cataractarum]
MPFLAVPNEIVLLIAEELQSQADLSALAQVDRRSYRLLRDVLYQYNLHHHNGDGIFQAAKKGSASAVAQFVELGYPEWSSASRGGPDEKKNGPKIPVEEGTRFLPAPIQLAALQGHNHVVEYLLSCSQSPPGDASMSLPPAAESGDMALVSMLVEYGADIDYQHRDTSTWDLWRAPTALSTAARRGHLALVEFLLDNGANINCRTGLSHLVSSHLGKTPLDLAVENGHEDVVRELVARGAIIDPECLHMAITRSSKSILEHLLTKVEFGDIQSQIDFLETAIGNDDMEVIKMLLDKGLDQEHALVTAITHDKEAIVTLLLEQGTNPDTPSVSWPRKPAIKAAIGRRHIGIIKALLCHRAHVDTEDLRFVRDSANHVPQQIAELVERFPVFRFSRNLGLSIGPRGYPFY